MHYRIIFATLLVGALFGACSNDDPGDDRPAPEEPQEELTNIKDKAAFNVGAAVKTAELKDLYKSTVLEHFNQITGEYEMKMDVIWSGENSFNWTLPDALVDFAATNNLRVHGHTLVWYRTFPAWFKNAHYDSAAFETHVKNYITTVVTRYKGKVVSWDVANEIFNDDGTLRSVDCPVYETFHDPVAFYGRCFQYARDADPSVTLFYNDYSLALIGSKRYYTKQMITRFRAEGYPIDGLGDQFHYAVNNDKTTLANGLRDMGTTGLLIHISELDIKMNVSRSDSYQFTPAEQALQAEMYKHIVSSFEALPQEQKFAITTWGVSDKLTWLTSSWHAKEYPLLFNSAYEKKPAYDGFLEGLK